METINGSDLRGRGRDTWSVVSYTMSEYYVGVLLPFMGGSRLTILHGK